LYVETEKVKKVIKLPQLLHLADDKTAN